jgi:hypothetical protein
MCVFVYELVLFMMGHDLAIMSSMEATYFTLSFENIYRLLLFISFYYFNPSFIMMMMSFFVPIGVNFISVNGFLFGVRKDVI